MVATVAGIHLSGNHAGRPAANTVPDGSLYSCTTHGLIYQSNFTGNSWATWATLGGGAPAAHAASHENGGSDEIDVTGLTGAGGGGGSGGVSDLPLDVVPSSPDADDDEFPGSSLDGAWTDPMTSAAGQTNTITVADGWMHLEPATAGTGSTGKRAFGIRKNSPTGSFTVSWKGCATGPSTDLRPGLWVAKTGGGGYVCGPGYQDGLAAIAVGFTGYSETADWGAFDGVTLTGAPAITFPRHLGWYRMRYDAGATTLYFDYSINGARWRNFHNKTSVTQPDRMGVALWTNSAVTQADEVLSTKWFRVIDGSAAF